MQRHLADLIRGTDPRRHHRVALTREDPSSAGPVSYRDLEQRFLACAASLVELGLKKGDRVALYADNSSRWLVVDLACLRLGAVDVPRGCDTTPGEMELILSHSGSRVLFLQKARDLSWAVEIRSKLPDLEHLVLMDPSFAEEDPDRGVHSLATLLARGVAGAAAVRERPGPERDDLATIVYTSGTTGDPKGVMLTHGNILHNVESFPSRILVVPEDSYLSLLPSWHMFERTVEYCVLSAGASIIYTDARRLRTDLRDVAPTLLAGVPRVWEILEQGVRGALHTRGAMARAVFGAGLGIGSRYRRARRRVHGQLSSRASEKVAAALSLCFLAPAHSVVDRLLFRKIRQETGGRLRAAISGGGALSTDVEEFFDTIGITLLNGYGLTETAPIISLRGLDQNVLGTIGLPLPGTEIRIEGEDGIPTRKGEVGVLLVRGPQVMKGYYREAETTRQVLTPEGWLNTGDLCCVSPGGHLVFSGRSKDVIVLSTGENVNPGPIEKALERSPFITRAVVVGQDRPRLGVLIEPDLAAVQEWAKRSGIPSAAGRDLMTDPRLQTLLEKEVGSLCHLARGFRSCEVVRRLRILPEPLSVERGTLTPTQKIRRLKVRELYGDLIDSMYRAEDVK